MIHAIRKEKTYGRDFLIILFSSIAIALIGRLEIPLPFTPVPLSFRPQLILFLALLLGSKRATLSTALFLGFGAIGIPVFAGATSSLIGPCGGYILGYLFGAFLAGTIYENTKRGSLAFIVGTLVMYLFGSTYLAAFVGYQKAILLGIFPFILGDIAKSILALKVLEKVRA